MAYKDKATVQSMVSEQLVNNPSKLYDLDVIKRKTYTEWAAETILQEIDKLIIAHVPERDTYDTGHTGCTKNDKGIATEKVIAKKLFNSKRIYHDTIGNIFDYEIPLSVSENDGLGDIDLVSETDDCIYLIEFKRPKSSESLLRCALEIYTYYKQLPEKKFIENFINTKKLKKAAPLKLAVLVFADSTAYKQYMDKEKNPKTHTLMKRLAATVDIDFYVLDNADDLNVTAV